MNVKKLLQRQWAGYRHTHSSRINLLIHAVTAPAFVLGSIAVVLGLLALSPWPVTAGAVAMASAMGLQALGHRLELQQPAPFTGGVDVVARIIVEQWVTFPRYLLSGSWRQGKATKANNRE